MIDSFLVLLQSRTYFLILRQDQLFYTSQDQLFRIHFPICNFSNCHHIYFCAFDIVSVFVYIGLLLVNHRRTIVFSPSSDPLLGSLPLRDLHMTKLEFHLFMLSILLRSR